MPFSPRMVPENEDVCRAVQVIFVFRDDAWAINSRSRIWLLGMGKLGAGGGARWGVIRSGLHMLGWSLWKFFLMGRMGGLGTGVRGGGYEDG